MNINDFLKKNDDGTFDIDEAGFTAALDRERNKASDTAKANTEKKLRAELEKEIKEKLEEEAKLSAEQKLQKQMEEFAEMKRAFDKDRVKTIYKDAGISDDEIELMLSLIGDDSDKNIATATKFADARKKANEEYEKKVKEDILRNSDRPDNHKDGDGDETEAERFAKMFSKKVVSDYVDLSGKTQDQ